MQAVSRDLDAYSFQSSFTAEVVCEDGAVFRIPQSFLREWKDPNGGQSWIFMFCEHYPAMLFSKDDLTHWANYERKWDPALECVHLPEQIKVGPRIPMRYGTSPTEVCECGHYRTTLHKSGQWQPGPPDTREKDDY